MFFFKENPFIGFIEKKITPFEQKKFSMQKHKLIICLLKTIKTEKKNYCKLSILLLYVCVCMRDDDVFLMTDLVLCLGRHCVFVLCDATETVRE